MSKGAGAPKGNSNAVSKKPWAAALDRALRTRSIAEKCEALDKLAEALLKKAEQGDVPALKELADRLDGRAIQYVDAQVDTNVTVEIIRFGSDESASTS